MRPPGEGDYVGGHVSVVVRNTECCREGGLAPWAQPAPRLPAPHIPLLLLFSSSFRIWYISFIPVSLFQLPSCSFLLSI